MDKIKFEDFCQNFIEEVNFLIPAGNNKFVEISHCFEGRDFIIFVPFDKTNFGIEIKHFIATIAKKTSEVFSKHWKIHQPTVEISTNPPCHRLITCYHLVFKAERD